MKPDGVQQRSAYSTQADADREGRALGKLSGAELQLHAEDGQIRAKDSYGNPFSTPRLDSAGHAPERSSAEQLAALRDIL